ncbi:MAG: inositol monophosphatase family protein [Paracoccaceae bacterium]
MQPITPSARLACAIHISEDAAQSSLRNFSSRTDLTIATKSPGQAVTEADRAVENEIRTAMAEHFPNEAIVGEEFGGEAQTSFWTLDPIDGTANFLNGLPFWGVAIGHMEEGEPDLGVISLPLLGMTIAGEGESLFVNGVAYDRRPPAIATVSLGQADQARLSECLSLHEQCRKADIAVYHWRCSAVSFAYAALGQISGHMHRGTTLWDAVPGAAICKAARMDVRQGTDEAGDLWIKAVDPAVHELFGDLWEGES